MFTGLLTECHRIVHSSPSSAGPKLCTFHGITFPQGIGTEKCILVDEIMCSMQEGKMSEIWNPLCDGDIADVLIDIALDESAYAYKEDMSIAQDPYLTESHESPSIEHSYAASGASAMNSSWKTNVIFCMSSNSFRSFLGSGFYFGGSVPPFANGDTDFATLVITSIISSYRLHLYLNSTDSNPETNLDPELFNYIQQLLLFCWEHIEKNDSPYRGNLGFTELAQETSSVRSVLSQVWGRLGTSDIPCFSESCGRGNGR
ncbi:hypothetical protein C8Q75DRAFT_735325 [Abortiporus biennis]|nr:hypothetical protein C8Q75DRAFT_735325 [Abortiporus biennis]